MSYQTKLSWSLLLLSGFSFVAVGCAGGADRPAAKTAADASKPYPLTTCVISGEKLDSMGKPVVIQYEGREVRFCCSECEKDFLKDPKPALAKLDAAAKNAAPTTAPATR